MEGQPHLHWCHILSLEHPHPPKREGRQ
ncbi:unnamed protein product [Spirodela intermedia]|uniref:Uncharacterized protein n=1 Tax=Spirodela intermedia TaxID=51605 RepID=A0A7I8K1L6_SPIIN|nr:unnamed protein product [Spirodela intermedia]